MTAWLPRRPRQRYEDPESPPPDSRDELPLPSPLTFDVYDHLDVRSIQVTVDRPIPLTLGGTFTCTVVSVTREVVES